MLTSLKRFTAYRKQHDAWQKKYDAAAPKTGDIAPDFELSDVSGQHSVRLSDFRGRTAVVLVFGSYT